MLLKPTGSHSLQLCRLFGGCTAVLLSSEFQPPSMESSHTCPGQTLAEWKGKEENRLSGTCLPNTEASPPRSAPSPRLPRPQHLAATSPTHTTIVATSQAPTKLHAAGPLPDTVSTEQLCPCQGSLSPPALGSLQLQGLLMGLGTQGWLRHPGHSTQLLQHGQGATAVPWGWRCRRYHSHLQQPPNT